MAPVHKPCRKRRYRDQLAAQIALADTGRRSRDETRAYRCPRCHGFHLTSQAKHGR